MARGAHMHTRHMGAHSAHTQVDRQVHTDTHIHAFDTHTGANTGLQAHGPHSLWEPAYLAIWYQAQLCWFIIQLLWGHQPGPWGLSGWADSGMRMWSLLFLERRCASSPGSHQAAWRAKAPFSKSRSGPLIHLLNPYLGGGGVLQQG